MRRKKIERLARVVALPGHDQPTDAIKFIREAAGNGKLRAVIMALVDLNGGVEIEVCGTAHRDELVWAGTKFTYEGIT